MIKGTIVSTLAILEEISGYSKLLGSWMAQCFPPAPLGSFRAIKVLFCIFASNCTIPRHGHPLCGNPKQYKYDSKVSNP